VLAWLVLAGVVLAWVVLAWAVLAWAVPDRPGPPVTTRTWVWPAARRLRLRPPG
jgi:hypothetical protein